MSSVSILTLNIGAASLIRARLILDWLEAQQCDVVVLTETSNGAGTEFILDRYRSAGWYVSHQRSPEADRGVAVVSRVAVLPSNRISLSGVSIAGRAVSITLSTEPSISVVGVYVPSRDLSPEKIAKKKTFIRTFVNALEAAEVIDRELSVLCGDYNAISRSHIPRYSTFMDFEYGLFDSLQDLGLLDAHASIAPGEDVHSWFGRTGDRYRYDYVHVGGDLVGRLSRSAYIQETRASGLSDHAATLVLIDVDLCNVLPASNALTNEPMSLF